jgi:multidrug efflux pump
MSIQLTFASGTNPDIAQVQAQNKLQQAVPLLPQIVQQQGISVSKSNNAFLLAVGFTSEDGKMNEGDIGDYLATNIVDPMSRVEGVGSVQLFGAKYAMRIWLDPGKLDTYHVTAGDVIAAIQGQNAQVSVGQLGDLPAVPGQQLNATITALGRMHSPEEFSNIVLRSNTDGSTLHLRDVARVELGQATYGFAARYNGKVASGMGITLATNANALRTVSNVQALLHRLEPTFPNGLKASIPYDTTPFVRKSIEEVVKTLAEAILLVFLVMYLFLQNLRATLIPTIAVPVVLLGTFAILQLAGYSINMLTMFAVVLAIGLLVDDAIVVVENVERLMTDEGLSPVEATRRSMDQITGALIGIATVLSAVFVPMAFLNGSSGVIYRQFSITIVSAMVLSVTVAIVVTPALCATLLKPVKKGEHHSDRGFFRWFNYAFDNGNRRYQGIVANIIGRPARFMLIYLALASLMGCCSSGCRPPTCRTRIRATCSRWCRRRSAPPAAHGQGAGQMNGLFSHSREGRGRFDLHHGRFQLQRFRSEQRAGIHTAQGLERAYFAAAEHPGHPGSGLWRAVPDQGCAGLRICAAADHRAGQLGRIRCLPEGRQGPGTCGADRGAQPAAGHGIEGQAAGQRAAERPGGRAAVPSRYRCQKAASLGLSMADVNDTLSVAWGGRYIDDFIDRGRVKHVIVQADAPFAWCRMTSIAGTCAILPATWFRWPRLPTRIGPTVRRAWSATTAWRRWISTVRRRRG